MDGLHGPDDRVWSPSINPSWELDKQSSLVVAIWGEDPGDSSSRSLYVRIFNEMAKIMQFTDKTAMQRKRMMIEIELGTEMDGGTGLPQARGLKIEEGTFSYLYGGSMICICFRTMI